MSGLEFLAGGAKTQRFKIPIEHLDFKYISQCKDVRELEKIYRLLKSGEEGSYPDLTEHVAKRLKDLAPKCRALRKNEPLLRASDLDHEERENLATDLEEWQSSMHEWRTEAAGHAGVVIGTDEAPPPRKAKNLLLSNSGNRTETVTPEAPSPFASGSKKKRHVPRSPDEWTKLEKQLEEEEEKQQQQEEEEQEKKRQAANKAAAAKKADPLPFKSKVPPTVSVDPSTPRPERRRIADDEKDKGNEAFRSGDFQEALVYYCRSLSVLHQANVMNNRALTYIKLKLWNKAIQDCNKVLKEEPDNAKALLRRATSFTEEHRLAEARRDAEAVLRLEPNEPRAKKLLSEIETEEEKRSKRQEEGSRRMKIEESSSEEEEEEEEEKEKLKEGERRLTIEECDDEEEEEEEEKAIKSSSAPPAPQESRKPCEEESSQPDHSAASFPASPSDIWTNDDLERMSKPSPPLKPVRPAAPPPKQLTKEEEFLQQKEFGNQCVKENKFSEALKFYDRCVELSPENIVGYNNRAVVHIRLERYNDAIYDCNMVLEMDPANVKALYRRGLARKHLGDFPESLVDFRAAMMFDAANKSISEEIKEVQRLLKETGGRRRMRIQEIEEEEEEEEEEEKVEEEEEVGRVDEDVPVIREPWPEGLAHDFVAKAKEEIEKTKKEVKEEKERLEKEAVHLGKEIEKGKAEEEELRKVTAEIEREKAELELLKRANEKKAGKKLLIEEISPQDSETEEEEEEKTRGEEAVPIAGNEGDKKVEEKEGKEEKFERETVSMAGDVRRKKVEGSEKEKKRESESVPGDIEERKIEGREEEDAESGGSWVEVEEEMLREDSPGDSISQTDAGPVTPLGLMTALLTSQPRAGQVGDMLLRMPPQQLPKYVSSQLDQKALACLISALHDEVLPRQKFDLVWQFLVAIREIKRFDIVRMFLGQNSLKDLKDLFQVLDDIRISGNLPKVSAEDLSTLRKSFCV